MVNTKTILTYFHILITGVIISSALLPPGLLTGQNSTTASILLSRRDLQALIKKANTSEQYKTLQGYYLDRERIYEVKAAQEKDEWVRRQKVYANVAVKFPSPVDSARNLYGYYMEMARAMASKAFFYANKAK